MAYAMQYNQQTYLEEVIMKELLKKFEDLWISITYAEAGEHEASREFLVQDVRDDERAEIFTVA